MHMGNSNEQSYQRQWKIHKVLIIYNILPYYITYSVIRKSSLNKNRIDYFIHFKVLKVLPPHPYLTMEVTLHLLYASVSINIVNL